MLAKPYLILAAVVSLLLAGFALGWGLRGWRASADLNAVKATIATADKKAAEAIAAANAANTAKLQRALTAADASIAIAQARERAATTTAEETRHALLVATRADRACLSAAAVRVLNGTAAPARPAGSGLRLPASAGGAAQPLAGAPAGPGDAAPGPAASERDVAEWIVTARRMYDTCRGRVDALRSWAAQTASP